MFGLLYLNLRKLIIPDGLGSARILVLCARLELERYERERRIKLAAGASVFDVNEKKDELYYPPPGCT